MKAAALDRKATKRALFCFPPAGAGIAFYGRWRRFAPPELQVATLQLPARENRLSEAPLRCMDDVVDYAMHRLDTQSHSAFAFFGHSMGALVAYELACALRAAGARGPAALFVSGCEAPACFRISERLHELPDEELVTALEGWGGVAPGALNDDELRALLLPAVRADFECCQGYRARPRAPLSCPIWAYFGESDQRVRPEAVREWRTCTDGESRCRSFPGGHFFISDRLDEVLQDVASVLAACSADD